MTNLNYLEADAALIVACLPEEIDDEITKEQLPLLHLCAADACEGRRYAIGGCA